MQSDLATLLTAFDAGNSTEQAKILLSAESFELMAKADQRPFAVRSSPYGVEVERTGASFASWYQIFPRSQSGDPHRHGTFDDVISRLPAIKDMGFFSLLPTHSSDRDDKPQGSQ
jgi:starch synthase (maltosyl-transferring)